MSLLESIKFKLVTNGITDREEILEALKDFCKVHIHNYVDIWIED